MGAGENSSKIPMKLNRLQLVNVCAYVLCTIFSNISQAHVPKYTNAEVSKRYTTPLTPAGFTFSIWGLIFCAEGCFAIWQALPRNASNALIQKRIGWWYASSCLFQSCWGLAFSVGDKASIWASVFLMAGIWFSLIAIVVRVSEIRISWTLSASSPFASLNV